MEGKVLQFLASLCIVTLGLMFVSLAFPLVIAGVVYALLAEVFYNCSNWLHLPVKKKEIVLARSWRQLVTNLTTLF